jgi:hypothetical protein
VIETAVESTSAEVLQLLDGQLSVKLSNCVVRCVV